jgi:RyR domain
MSDVNEVLGTVPPAVLAAARAAHEVNRTYCRLLGDVSQVAWEDAPEWQRRSAIKGALGVLFEGNGPRESHASWLAEKQREGWVYGAEKDAVQKTHPCMVPYDELPPSQMAKDAIFTAVVRGTYAAYPDMVHDAIVG